MELGPEATAYRFDYWGNPSARFREEVDLDRLPWRRICAFLEEVEIARGAAALCQKILDTIRLLLDFDCAFCVVTDAPSSDRRVYDLNRLFYMKDVPDLLMSDYLGYYIRFDPLTPRLRTFQRVDIDWPHFGPSEFTFDFLRRYRIRHTLALSDVSVSGEDGFFLSVHRGGRTRVCGRDRGVLAAIYPHLHNLFMATLDPERSRTRALRRAAEEAGLTRREREVLLLLCSRLTAGEMADLLSIRKRTVEKHLEHLYAKLGARGRRQVRDKFLQGSRS